MLKLAVICLLSRGLRIYIYGSNVIAGRSYLLAIAFSAVQAALAEQELRQCENVLSQFFLISQRRSDSCI